MGESTQLGVWSLIIDTIKTMQYNERYSSDVNCGCLSCQNYHRVCDILVPELKEFFSSLGLDPHKEVEVIDKNIWDSGKRIYYGFYHIVGSIVTGPTALLNSWDNPNVIKIDGFRFMFSTELCSVPNGFSDSLIQLDFEAQLPWLMEEQPG